MSGQYGHPPAPYQHGHGSVEEVEQQQRQLQQQQLQPQPQQPLPSQQQPHLQQQQQQQQPPPPPQPQQQQQHEHQQPIQPGHYQHPPSGHGSHPYGGQYNNPQLARQQGQDHPMDVPSDNVVPRPGSGKTTATAPKAPGKEPEGVQHLENDVASALVSIQHENRSLSEAEPHKRARPEESRPMDSFSDHSQRHHMTGEGDMRGRVHRSDLAQVEKDTVLILGMMRHEGSIPHRHPQHPGAHPQSEHQHPPQQHDAPPAHSSYARAHGYHPEQQQPPFDPHHPAMKDDQIAKNRKTHVGLPRDIPYDPHTTHGRIEEQDRSRGLASHPDVEDRNAFPRQPRTASSGPLKQPNVRLEETGRWAVESPTRGRGEMMDASFHGQQQPQSPFLQQYPPMLSQHQPHYASVPPHQREQWPDAPVPNQDHPHHVYQNGLNQEAPTHSAGVGVEHREAGFISSNGIGAVKPKAAKGKAKPKSGVKTSSENERAEGVSGPLTSASERSYDSHQQYSPVQDQHRISQQTGESMVSDERTQIKSGRGKGKTKPSSQLSGPSESHSNGVNGVSDPGTFTHRTQETSPVSARPPPPENGTGIYASTGGHDEMLLGSGMILVRGPPSSTDGSRQFPPSQLSIKTTPNVAMTSEPPSSSSLSSPSTPMSSGVIKKKRPRLPLEHGDKDQELGTTPGSPKQPHSAKSEHAPLSPPPPPPPSRGKSSYRSRKGVVSTDADIERSNEITRLSGGPSWLNNVNSNGNNNTNSSGGSGSSGSSNNLNGSGPTTAAAGLAKAGDASSGSASSNAAVRRRPPLPSPLAENEKRKRKRIKIDDKDVREDQRTSSSSITETGEIKDEAGMDVTSNSSGRGGNTSSKAAGTKRIGVTEDGNERDNEDDDTIDGEEEDEVLEEGERETGDIMGPRKRRSPADDDDDQGDDDTNATGGGSGGNSHGGTNSHQSRGSGEMGGRKSMKRKSNGNFSGGGKKLKEKSNCASTVSSPEDLRSNSAVGSSKNETFEGTCNKPGRPRKTGAGVKKESEAGAEIAESDTEIDYLPMEDDPECPHMFGIDETDREKDSSASEDDAEDDDDASVKDDTDTGAKSTGASSTSKKTSNSPGQKGRESSEMPDDIQKQGREWVSRLAMPESAWEESYKTYEKVKRFKELKNRQPVRKRDAILAAILYIVCRDQGAPRTFSEICSASNVKRGDIGSYYRLMRKILEPKGASASARDTDAEAFMTRWCESLSLSPLIRKAAVHVFSVAGTLNLTSGKCPSSVGAASIYLCIFAWNDARRTANCRRYQCSGCQCQSSAEHPLLMNDERSIKKEAKDVAIAVGVVSATLMGCFKNLSPEKDRLLPPDFLIAAVEGL
ncbi:Transcription initiation factor IIB [Modicella reniformis]|uniref:Transcription initiation factor IIB n=1 Tax=Modicella reniformis TaxID=1440133 RepID=A0A9P6SLY0_9FUNG|nr:Transcription initiation factor IIB [Modicella reniformis]